MPDTYSSFPLIIPLFLLQINVRVTTMDAELEFAIQPNTTGKQLFDQVSFNHMKFPPFDTIVWMQLHPLSVFWYSFTDSAAP